MAANALSIAKQVAKLTQGERGLVMELAALLSGQRRYTRKKGRVAVATVARKAKDPNAPKRQYTKRSPKWFKAKKK